MGRVPKHREDSRKVPPSGGTETDGEDAAAEPGWYVDTPFPGVGNVGGGRAGGGDLYLRPS